MIAAALKTSLSEEWATPPDLFAKLNDEFNFTLDVAASDTNHKLSLYFTKEDDALRRPWPGRIWMNPPYGRQIGLWMKKAYEEVLFGNAKIVVALVHARTDTRWFHDHVYGKAKLRFLRGRVRFSGAANGAPFPSMLAIYSSGAAPQI